LIKAIWVIVGKLGLSFNDLFYFDLEELHDIAEGHYQVQRAEWERARFVAWSNFRVYNKQIKITDVTTFAWEKKEIKKSSPEEIINHGQKLLELVNSGKVQLNKK
jgi:hypothetical protein